MSNEALGEMFGRWGAEAAKQELRAERAEARAEVAEAKLARVRWLAEWSAADYPETVLREILRVVVFGPDDEKPPQA